MYVVVIISKHANEGPVKFVGKAGLKMNQGNKIQKTTVQVCHTELMMMMIVSMG
jgi:hypothetical protein